MVFAKNDEKGIRALAKIQVNFRFLEPQIRLLNF
jgi:hypothetical protein